MNNKFWIITSLLLVSVLGTLNHSAIAPKLLNSPDLVMWPSNLNIYLHRVGGTPLAWPIVLAVSAVGVALIIVGFKLPPYGQVLKVLGWLITIYCWTPRLVFFTVIPIGLVILRWVIMGFGSNNPYAGNSLRFGWMSNQQVQQMWGGLWQRVFSPRDHQRRNYTILIFVICWGIAFWVLSYFLADPNGGHAVYQQNNSSLAPGYTMDTIMLLFTCPFLFATWLEMLAGKPDQSQPVEMKGLGIPGTGSV